MPHDLCTPLLDIYLKNTKTLSWKDTCTPMFIAALFTIAKIWKQPKCPSMDEWIKKMWYTHTHTHTHIYTMEYYLAIRKNEILPFVATWMDLEGIMLSEISQTKTNTMWSHLYVESKTKQTKTPRDLPGGPVAETPCSQFRGPGFDPWSGNWIPHATTRSLHATTKDPACRN